MSSPQPPPSHSHDLLATANESTNLVQSLASMPSALGPITHLKPMSSQDSSSSDSQANLYTTSPSLTDISGVQLDSQVYSTPKTIKPKQRVNNTILQKNG